MQRILSALALAGVLALGACASGPSTSPNAIAADAQALLAAAEANGSISQGDAAIVSDIITGFETVASATEASVTGGDSTTVTALKTLDTAIGEVAADSTSSTVSADATKAEALVADLLTGGTTVTQAQVKTAVATFLIDYLASHSSASAAPGSVSPTQLLIEDARAQIATIS
ncbi:MAG TPA: hypothetical protein VFG62_10365 [Rhodopila sp.]|jgi:hypothetical protein|nr:hypothetical protein [Rhodopila sp.]